jgi:hypothetical protein
MTRRQMADGKGEVIELRIVTVIGDRPLWACLDASGYKVPDVRHGQEVNPTLAATRGSHRCGVAIADAKARRDDRRAASQRSIASRLNSRC